MLRRNPRKRASKTVYWALNEGFKRHGENFPKARLRRIIGRLGGEGRYSFTVMGKRNSPITYTFWVEGGKVRVKKEYARA